MCTHRKDPTTLVKITHSGGIKKESASRWLLNDLRVSKVKRVEEGLGKEQNGSHGVERQNADAFLEEQNDCEFGRSIVYKLGKSETWGWGIGGDGLQRAR